MTLSGNSDKQARADAARAARQDRGAVSASRRPWLLPAVIAVAVMIVVGVVVVSIATGSFVG